jgi:hypothetical protein
MIENAVESKASEEVSGSEDVKYVPVAESIRYRKRAQAAEGKLSELNEELAAERCEKDSLRSELETVRDEQELISKLSEAGAEDIEAAVLLAKKRLSEDESGDIDGCIAELCREKGYLFKGRAAAKLSVKTAGARSREDGVVSSAARAAKQASVTGSRRDVQEYLRLRRKTI